MATALVLKVSRANRLVTEPNASLTTTSKPFSKSLTVGLVSVNGALVAPGTEVLFVRHW